MFLKFNEFWLRQFIRLTTPVIFSLLVSFNAQAKQAADESEYLQAAERLVKLWNGRSHEDFSGMLSSSRIGYRALKGTSFTEKQKKAYIMGLKAGLRQAVHKMIDTVPEDSYVKLLKTSPMNDGVKALIRVDYGDSGLGYVEFYLQETTRSGIKVVDWFDYSRGQLVSEVLRQLLAVTMPSSSYIDNFFNVVSGKAVVRQEIIKLFKSIQAKDYGEFANLYRGLSEETKQNKQLMVVAVSTAALSQDELLYQQVLDDLYKYHHNDPKISFLLIDYLFYQEKYSAALQSVKAFREQIGVEDAGLMVLESNLYTMSGNYDDSIGRAEKAIKIEPEYEDAYWSLLFGLSRAGEYQRAIQVAELLEDRYDYLLDDEALAADSSYDGLRNSSEFRVWRAGR